jgi:rod shape-determining protein MreC
VGVTVFHPPFALVQSTIVDLAQVSRENERLQLALREATLLLTRLQEIDRENERLRGILNFDPPPDYVLVQAKVVSVSGAAAPVSAVINRGTRDSVEVNMPIINQQGLIGRVVSVFDNVATVQLLTDPTHRVAARVAESRGMGIVRYSSTDGMLLDNYPIQDSIRVGDQILSSGLGGIYPPGLVVGTVAAVGRPEEAPFCDVTVDPAANFNTLEELFVMRISQP